jgi:short-subunit dehydrogenase
MAQTERPWALVTGASAGIGRAVAEVLAEAGHNLVLTARRAERLAEIGGDLSRRWGARFLTVPLDLGEAGAVGALYDETVRHGLFVEVLVNDAGYGRDALFVDVPWEEMARQAQVMALAVAQACRLFLPPMVARRRGRVMNVSSMVGFHGVPRWGLYAPCKAFVTALSATLAEELQGTGVTVTALCPGFTRTEFHDVAGVTAKIHAEIPDEMWMDAASVAREGVRAMMAGVPVYVPGEASRAWSRATLAQVARDWTSPLPTPEGNSPAASSVKPGGRVGKAEDRGTGPRSAADR